MLAASSASQGPGLGILARSAWLQRGNTLSLITEMFTIPLFCKLTTDTCMSHVRMSMQILGTANSTQPPATVCPSQKVRSVGGAQGATQLRWQRRSGLTAHFTALVVTFVRAYVNIKTAGEDGDG